MDNDRKPLLDLIRECPVLYLGEPSLSALRHFMFGFDVALMHHGLQDAGDFDVPQQFHDWVAYRLHFEGSMSGWCRMILKRTGSEEQAFFLFFELLDEFRSKTPHVVAKLVGYQKTFIRTANGITETCQYPDSISLVTYTNDPGFFAYSDGQGDFPDNGRFFPSIDSFETCLIADRNRLTIVDQNWNYGLRKEAETM